MEAGERVQPGLYRILHLRVNSLNLLEVSATGKKMTSWTVHCLSTLVFIQQVHTQDLENIHGRRMGPRSRWPVLAQLSSNTQNFVAKEALATFVMNSIAWARLPVVTPGLVMTAKKGAAEWFISSHDGSIGHLKAMHRKKV